MHVFHVLREQDLCFELEKIIHFVRCSPSIDCREMASLSVFVFVLTLSIDVFYHFVCGYSFMFVFCSMRAM